MSCLTGRLRYKTPVLSSYSLYHNPHFGSAIEVSMHKQQCWNSTNWSSMKPQYRLVGLYHGHLEVMLLPKENKLICNVYPSAVNCDPCDANKTLKAGLSLDEEGQQFCIKTTTSDLDHKTYELSIKCIVAKCPGMTGTVPEFLHLSRTCPCRLTKKPIIINVPDFSQTLSLGAYRWHILSQHKLIHLVEVKKVAFVLFYHRVGRLYK